MTTDTEIKIDPFLAWAWRAAALLRDVETGAREVDESVRKLAGDLCDEFAAIEQAERNAENAPGEEL